MIHVESATKLALANAARTATEPVSLSHLISDSSPTATVFEAYSSMPARSIGTGAIGANVLSIAGAGTELVAISAKARRSLIYLNPTARAQNNPTVSWWHKRILAQRRYEGDTQPAMVMA